MSLTTKNANSGLLKGKGLAEFCPRVNSNVASRNFEFVAEGIKEIHDIKKLLKHYVMHDLCKDI